MPRLPTIFFGHGSPMATLGGRYADIRREMAGGLSQPKADHVPMRKRLDSPIDEASLLIATGHA